MLSHGLDGFGRGRLALGLLGTLSVWAQSAWAGQRQLSGWVMDDDGPVANAEVRLVVLRPEPCPCKKPGDEPMDEFPWCPCGRATGWMQRLAACPAPARALARTHSDAKGRFSLPLTPPGNAIEVESEKGVRWLALPRSRKDVSIDLRPSWNSPLELTFPDGRPAQAFPGFLAGLIFPDGHCVPLAQRGSVWAPVVPVPDDLDQDMIFAATGSTLAPIAEDRPTLAPRIDLPLWTTLQGHCDSPKAPGTSTTWVTWTTRFHEPRKVRAAEDGAFAFEHVPDVQATMVCQRQDAPPEQWSYTPKLGLSFYGRAPSRADECRDWDGDRQVGLAPTKSPGSKRDACCTEGVLIVDQRGRPVPGARVGWLSGSYGVHAAPADQQGRICGEIPQTSSLEVTHPEGRCFGYLWQHLPAPPDPLSRRPLLRIVLPVTEHRRSPLRGRVLSAEGRPVAGASVTVSEAQLGDCNDNHDSDFVETSPDGSFTLPALAHGQYALRVFHSDYAERSFQVRHPGGQVSLVVDRGASWKGVLYSPEGRVLTPDSLEILCIDHETDKTWTATSPKPGQPFLLRHLSAGKTTLKVSLTDDPQLGTRLLILEGEIAANEQREQDIHWPAGPMTLAGQVVNGKTGASLPGVKITALPKGLSRSSVRQPDEVTVVSDHEGRFAFRHMAAKTWVLYVQDKEVAVAGSTTRDLRLTTDAPGS